MSVTICHASIDERKKIAGGAAGDQTGKEVCTKVYSDKDLPNAGFKVCLIHPDAAIRKAAANAAEKLAKSGLVGYDQGNRNSLYAALKKNGFNIDKYIASGVKTETDCSAFMYACYSCFIPKMRSDSNAPTTSTMTDFYKKHGFEAKTDKDFITAENLKKGMILVNPGHHTVMVYEVVVPVKVETPKTEKSKCEYYKKCASGYQSIVDALHSVGETDASLTHRKKIANANKVSTADNVTMNTKLLLLLKSGKLIKA